MALDGPSAPCLHSKRRAGHRPPRLAAPAADDSSVGLTDEVLLIFRAIYLGLRGPRNLRLPLADYSAVRRNAPGAHKSVPNQAGDFPTASRPLREPGKRG